MAGFALAIGLPWLAVISLLRAGRWEKIIGAIFGVPLLLYSCIVLLVFTIYGPFAYGHDLSFDRFAERAWKGSKISLYRTNGGATTDFGVVIM